ncbi:hypothetical protein ABT256_30380 [Amycolatopsis japonica]|uniref:hypothetical protein n=1 Tax=Amycolatopsis japonica TaxID=208439 RepID=UPI0033243F09
MSRFSRLLTPVAAAGADSIDVGPVSMATSMNCWGDAWVTLNGDRVTARHWMCHNNSGGGATEVCDFDWPQGYVGFKTAIFFAWDGIREYKMGTLRHWRDG